MGARGVDVIKPRDLAPCLSRLEPALQDNRAVRWRRPRLHRSRGRDQPPQSAPLKGRRPVGPRRTVMRRVAIEMPAQAQRLGDQAARCQQDRAQRVNRKRRRNQRWQQRHQAGQNRGGRRQAQRRPRERGDRGSRYNGARQHVDPRAHSKSQFGGETRIIVAQRRSAGEVSCRPIRQWKRQRGVVRIMPRPRQQTVNMRLKLEGIVAFGSRRLGSPAADAEGRRCYGWMTVSLRLMTKASRRSTKSPTTSAKASGRSVLIACPAS